ncbi:uncharacterized protein LOC123918223 [Trifolium pratense]|uniref:uncharacterized protein LOC123918223 n=1 Tax=Trifolium pratense TaxID=57577 RepID=UPI001E690A98|nr:uncharacterized protein LOC123918223 [Trifolium pratense]
MEESQNMMWMKRKQVLNSHIEEVPSFEVGAMNMNNKSWEEKAFAEDAARILGGCIWPPRSYSCHFCKREFRSAQALGGHMNVHRRDRAKLKQSLGHHNELDLHSLHKNHFTTSRVNSSSWPSTISKQENCFESNMSSSYSSSIRWGNYNHMVSHDFEPKGLLVNAREQIFKGYSCNDYVETSLSMGQNNSMFGQKLLTDDFCGDKGSNTCKKPRTSSIFHHKPCLNDRCLTFQSADQFVNIGIKPGMEDLDLELRLGKLTQKV